MTGSIKRNDGGLAPGSLLIGVAGGSGSGKTFFARALQSRLGAERCEIVYQDNFYFDQSKRFDRDGGSVNFDHPDSIDFVRLAAALQQLRSGAVTQIPIYDFVTHSRQPDTLGVRPARVIVVDGILILHSAEVRAQLDETYFFETPEDVRFQRRLERDVKERGRTPEGVHAQFFKQVKPMHDTFVEPSKAHASEVIREDGELDRAIAAICARCRA